MKLNLAVIAVLALPTSFALPASFAADGADRLVATEIAALKELHLGETRFATVEAPANMTTTTTGDIMGPMAPGDITIDFNDEEDDVSTAMQMMTTLAETELNARTTSQVNESQQTTSVTTETHQHHESQHQHNKSEKARVKAANHLNHEMAENKHQHEIKVANHRAKAAKHLKHEMEEEEQHEEEEDISMPTTRDHHHHHHAAKASKTKSTKSATKAAKAHHSISMPITSVHHSISMPPHSHPLAKSGKSKSNKGGKTEHHHHSSLSMPNHHHEAKAEKDHHDGKTHKEEISPTMLAPQLDTPPDGNNNGSVKEHHHHHGKAHKHHGIDGAEDMTADMIEDIVTTDTGIIVTTETMTTVSPSDGSPDDAGLDDAAAMTTVSPPDGSSTMDATLTSTTPMSPMSDTLSDPMPDNETQPVVRTPDVKHGTDTLGMQNEKFTQEVKDVMLGGGGVATHNGHHNQKENVDAVDLGAENGSVQMASNSVASSGDMSRSGVMVGGFCLLASSIVAAMIVA